MKLVTKQTYHLLAVYFSIFVLIGISFYYVTSEVISEDFNKVLYRRKYQVMHHLSTSDSIIKYQQFFDNTIAVHPSVRPLAPAEKINDTLLFDKSEDIFLGYRQLYFTASVKGKYYEIWVRRLLIETESLAAPLLILTIILFIILLVSLFLANRWVSKKVLKPFYSTLERLKEYQVKEMKSITFPQTDIQEFHELNTAISQMTERIRRDFYVLKEFTENTSHELQTPLAVIKSKLELLMQADNLTDIQYKYLSASYASANNLSRLNEALGLLSKIENSQFVHVESVDVCSLINQKIFNYEDLLGIKSIEVRKNFYAAPVIMMNTVLADILIENLINNSIKHNIYNGKISIETGEKTLTLSNTGNALQVAPDSLFRRFTKSNSQSFGLGLSIVREICAQNDIEISYACENEWHTITLKL